MFMAPRACCGIQTESCGWRHCDFVYGDFQLATNIKKLLHTKLLMYNMARSQPSQCQVFSKLFKRLKSL